MWGKCIRAKKHFRGTYQPLLTLIPVEHACALPALGPGGPAVCSALTGPN